MDQNQTRDSKYTSLNYNMGLIIGETISGTYNRPSSQVHGNNNIQITAEGCSEATLVMTSESNMDQGGCVNSVISSHRGFKRSSTNLCFHDNSAENHHISESQSQALDAPQNCLPNDANDCFNNLCGLKRSQPFNGKKTKGRVKIKMEYIDNKLRRYTTFSKRKTGIMKKAYELSTLTGTQVMLLVASETGHVYTFATRKLQPMITSETGKALIQTCLNSPDSPLTTLLGEQRMSATGFEETELTYSIADDDQKVRQLVYGSQQESRLNVDYASSLNNHNTVHASSSLSELTHLTALSHPTQNSHLVPRTSPNSMLAVTSYIQSDPSTFTSQASFNHQVSLLQNQRT